MTHLIPYILWGLAFGFILSAPVGPVNIICIRRSIYGRARDGFAIGLGAALGDTFYAVFAALGLKAIISLINSYDIYLRLFGACVMLVFAIRIWRSHPHLSGKQQLSRVGKACLAALVLTLANPGIFFGFLGLYTMAGLGDLSGRAPGGAGMDVIGLALGVFLGGALWWAVLTGFIRLIRNKINDRFLEFFNHIFAALIAVFAFLAAYSAFAKM